MKSSLDYGMLVKEMVHTDLNNISLHAAEMHFCLAQHIRDNTKDHLINMFRSLEYAKGINYNIPLNRHFDLCLNLRIYITMVYSIENTFLLEMCVCIGPLPGENVHTQRQYAIRHRVKN